MGLSLADAERILAGLAKLDTIHDLLVTLGEHMATAKQQLDELQTKFNDTSADVRARLEQLNTKVDQLTAQLGELPADAQATLDSIKADLQQLDEAVGDADGSDTPTEPEPTA